jgi:hypothetical protein
VTSPAEVVQRQVDAYNAGDAEAFGATYAEDAVVRHAGSGTVRRGRAQVVVEYGRLFAAHPGLRAEVRQRICAGSWVVDHEVVTTPAGGRVEAVAAYRVVDGLIREVLLLDG